MGITNTKEVLLKTATDLFSRKGYAATSIRDIGAKGGISSSIIYHYFKNKEEILFTIIFSESQELIKSLLEIENRVSDPVECLKEMLKEQSIIFSLKGKKGDRLLLETDQLRGKRREIIQNIQRGIYEIYKRVIKRIKDQGLLKDKIDQTVIIFSIFGIINSFHLWYRKSGRLSEEEVAEGMLKIVLNAIIK